MCLYLTLINNLIYVARILDRIIGTLYKKSSKTRQHQKFLISVLTEFLTAKCIRAKKCLHATWDFPNIFYFLEILNEVVRQLVIQL